MSKGLLARMCQLRLQSPSRRWTLEQIISTEMHYWQVTANSPFLTFFHVPGISVIILLV